MENAENEENNTTNHLINPPPTPLPFCSRVLYIVYLQYLLKHILATKKFKHNFAVLNVF